MPENKRTPSMKRVMGTSEGLKRGMKTRDAIMVAVGGTLGTGLFLSSGDVLATAGPGGAILAYIIGGIIIWLMTSCLGEMAAAMPVAGNSQAYCTEYISPAMGMTMGWLNWLGGALTITAQVTASAIIMKDILPSSSVVMWIVVFTALLFAVNFFGVRMYGNISFYFASLKIVLIVVFVIVGAAMIFFGLGNNGQPVGTSNLLGHGGFLPLGIGGVGAAFLSGFYAFGGTEMVAVTGSELEKEEDVPKVINWTLILLIGSYVLAMLVTSCLLPWDQADLSGSPFVYVFRNAGMHGAALLVNIVVLTSALSSGNYFVYACARYLWSMSKFEQAPKAFAKTNKNGVPVLALCISMAMGLIGVVSSFVAETTVYQFVIWLIGGVNVFLYFTICVCQYRFRKKFLAEGGKTEDLPYKTLYPVTAIVGALAFIGILIVSLMDPSEAVTFYVCIPTYAIIYLLCHIYVKKKGGDIKHVEI